MTQTIASIKAVTDAIRYPGGAFRVASAGANGYSIQFVRDLPNTHNAKAPATPQSGRKWLVSKWAVAGEVLQTAFMAVLTFEEHEVRENFRYKGRAVFGPHLTLTALWNNAGEVEYRT